MIQEKKRSNVQESHHYSFFSHTSCEYFPCHKGISMEDFNCLFCYCPLYALGEHCGGSPKFLENGVKACTDCSFPHHRDNYSVITGKFQEILKLMKIIRPAE